MSSRQLSSPLGIHFSPFPHQLSGANRSLLTLVEELARRGPVFVSTLCEGALAVEARRAGATVITSFSNSEKEKAKSRWRRLPKTIDSLRQAIQRYQIQFVHCHSAAGSRCVWPAARITGVPLITHQREMYRSDAFHRGLGLADHILVVSQWVKRSLPRRLHAKLSIIYDAVSLPSHTATIARQDGPLRVGMAGRCIPGKGHDLLIEAVLALKNRFEFETHIWGMESGKGAVYAQQLHEQLSAAGEGVQTKVHFQPFRHDMENFYRAMDIVVVPSRNSEGLPRMALEAMAWGKPTVVAGHSGLIEVVDHGRTGLVFRSGDWRSLAEQLQRLLTTEILRCQLRDAARAEVARRFSVQAHADAVEAVYRNVLSGPCSA